MVAASLRRAGAMPVNTDIARRLREAAGEGAPLSFSLEFFTPDTSEGVDDL